MHHNEEETGDILIDVTLRSVEVSTAEGWVSIRSNESEGLGAFRAYLKALAQFRPDNREEIEAALDEVTFLMG